MARTSFAYRVEQRDPVHVTVGVFAGADEQHRGKCGTLIFREDGRVFEWSDFCDRVLGPGHTMLEPLPAGRRPDEAQQAEAAAEYGRLAQGPGV